MSKNKGALTLWLAYPTQFATETAIAKCQLLLSSEERARWQAFHYERDSRQFLATRYLVRTALSYLDASSPESWRFSANPYGKPAINPFCGLHFNISNSPDLVACLFSHQGEVGVDLEPEDRAKQVLELAPDIFSELEVAQLNDLPETHRANRALSLWTLKEAYTKARGLGLSLPLRQCSFIFSENQGIAIRLDNLHDDSQRWRFCLLEHLRHQIALIAELSGNPILEVWEAGPSTEPRQLLVEQPQWFPRPASLRG